MTSKWVFILSTCSVIIKQGLRVTWACLKCLRRWNSKTCFGVTQSPVHLHKKTFTGPPLNSCGNLPRSVGVVCVLLLHVCVCHGSVYVGLFCLWVFVGRFLREMLSSLHMPASEVRCRREMKRSRHHIGNKATAVNTGLKGSSLSTVAAVYNIHISRLVEPTCVGGADKGNKTWSLWDAFVQNRGTEHLLPSADIAHASLRLQRENPAADKGKAGEERVPFPSLKSRLVFRVVQYCAPFWFEPDSFTEAPLFRITGREMRALNSLDVEERGKTQKKTTGKHREKTNKYINKSTTVVLSRGRSQTGKRCNRHCSGERFKLWLYQ